MRTILPGNRIVVHGCGLAAISDIRRVCYCTARRSPNIYPVLFRMVLLKSKLTTVLFLLYCSIITAPRRINGQTDVVQNCLSTSNRNGLPSFRGYTGDAGKPDRRIHHRHQAIIPSYKLNCCGNITEWGVDVNPPSSTITFDFDFQVWRPSPTVNETGCYSLVDSFMTTSISIPPEPQSNHVARVTPSPQDQLRFRPGDVLGFYVESHGEGDHPGGDDNNGVVLINSAGYTSELVWHGRITTQTSQAGSCPYPVGTDRVLSLSTLAAPVISIKTTTSSCAPNHSSSNHGGLIAGISVPVTILIVTCVSTLVIMTAVVIRKRSTKERTSNSVPVNTTMALTNQVYG